VTPSKHPSFAVERDGARYSATLDVERGVVSVERDGIVQHETPVGQNGVWRTSPRWLPASVCAELAAALAPMAAGIAAPLREEAPRRRSSTRLARGVPPESSGRVATRKR
jgi:hypothetical protein